MTEEEKALNNRQEWALKTTSLLYDKASAYTNLIMAAGYAAYFALWSNTNQLISNCLARISATLMLVSLATFMFWEVAKMILIALNNKNLSKVALAPLNQFDRALHEHSIKEQTLMARLAIAWPIILFIAVPTALIAISIHLWALVSAEIIG